MNWAVIADTLGGINWAAWSFIVLMAVGYSYLMRLDKTVLLDMITDVNGKGYSPSFTYIGCFIVGAWLCWYLAVVEKYTESAATFALMMAGFVTGSILRGKTESNERTALKNADKLVPDPAPGTRTITDSTAP